MRLNLGEVLTIVDLGNHSAVTIIRLGFLLAGAVTFTPDPKRKDFYEVEGHSTVYYIYVSPIAAIISLIAVWQTHLDSPGSSTRLAQGDFKDFEEPD